jgi:hypothetical protein
LARLNAVSDASWKLVRQAEKDKDHKLYTEALRLAKDVSNDITNLVTNNKSLVDAAYENVQIVIKLDEEQIVKLSGASKESESTEDEQRLF